MSRRLTSMLILSAAFSGSLALSAAHAADRDFCRGYSRAAVRQFHEAQEHGRCRAAIRDDPNRWHGDYRSHFEWCRSADVDDASRERDSRKRVLDDCVHD